MGGTFCLIACFLYTVRLFLSRTTAGRPGHSLLLFSFGVLGEYRRRKV